MRNRGDGVIYVRYMGKDNKINCLIITLIGWWEQEEQLGFGRTNGLEIYHSAIDSLGCLLYQIARTIQ